MRRTVLLLVLALIVTRAWLVLCGAEVHGFGEEFAKGAAAKAMLDGLPVEHHKLCYGYPEGGGFVVTHVKAFFFLLVGPSVLAHKLAALSFATCVLLAGLLLAAEHVSRRAALFFGLCFVLAPRSVLVFSLLNLGTHFEACALLALTLHFALCLARGVEQRGGEPRGRDALLLGLVAGFGTYFSLQILPALAAAGALLLARWRGRIPLALLARSAAGFALGALPLWIMLSLVGKDALWVERPANQGPGTPWTAALASLVAPVTRSGDVLLWVHALGFALAALVALLPRGTRGALLLAGYLALFAAAFGASGLALDYLPEVPGSWFLILRTAPFWMFGTLLACAGLDRLWDRGHLARGLCAIALGAALLGGARDLVAYSGTGRPGAPLENLRLAATTKGYLYGEYFDRFVQHLRAGDAGRAEILLAYDDVPELLAPAVAQSVYEASGRDVRAALEEIPGVFGVDTELALLGLGHVLHGGWTRDMPTAFARLETLPLAARGPLAEALGRAGFGPQVRRIDRLAPLVELDVPAAWRERWLAGVGWRVHQAFRLRPDLAEAWLAEREPADRAALRAGWGRARAADQLGRGRTP